MDTSRIYIKMCDCPEVQGEWKLKQGDFAGFPLTGAVSIKYIDEDDEYYSPKKARTIKKCNTWLPRQDQIQEMFGIKTAEDFCNAVDNMLYERDTGGIYDNMAEWLDVFDKQKTPEQLWLAYYMHEKHGKEWNGEKWVKGQV